MLGDEGSTHVSMNLATPYLGLTLRNPLIVGASPLCDDIAVARQLEDAGASAVVMRSLFEEQFEGIQPKERTSYVLSPAAYLEQLAGLKRQLSIPVIASLNGSVSGHWVDIARALADAGADAIELNCYRVVTETTVPSNQVETDVLHLLSELKAAINLPIAVKLSPYHTALAEFATALELAGASGIVVFNRFYQPDFDIEELEVTPQLHLSRPDELLLRLRWLAILSPNLQCSLAAGGGIHRAEDIVKALLAGAHGVQLVSVLLTHGPRVIPTLLAGVRAWMERHHFNTAEQFRGYLNLARCPDASAFERANYLQVLQQPPLSKAP